MMEGSRDPWNPIEVVDVTPAQYEEQVVNWLRQSVKGPCEFHIEHQARQSGDSGDYALDGSVKFEILGGAKISVLVECKRHRRPVDRDTVLGVYAKMNDLHFQKAIIFSVSGFQRGAIEYANTVGIALVSFVGGRAIYFTRSAAHEPIDRLPQWVPRFAGQMLSASERGVNVSTITNSSLEALSSWLTVS